MPNILRLLTIGVGVEMVLKCQILFWNISRFWITKQHGFIGGQKEVELKLDLINVDVVQYGALASEHRRRY